MDSGQTHDIYARKKRSMAIITCEKYFFIGMKLAEQIFIPPNLHLVLILIAFVG